MPQIRDLIVFEYLRVNNLRVTPRQVRATYTLLRSDGLSFHQDLIYSYPEPFLDPKQPDDWNLASMMVAQVAMNYGLFCKKLVFEGSYDPIDQRFIKDFTENTAREIFVNKFLLENPFLLAPYNRIEAEKRDSYSAADIQFLPVTRSFQQKSKLPAQTDPFRFAILSSGGKDSLLTYGLIRELGEPHPVFINESGRHWYTAYNAYHHFKTMEPKTVKPWCNSDRVFNWAVSHMPFINPGYQQIRADIYPIRLWTVAVFLFGVLPVVRKRGLGHVLIGNEYDSTYRTNFKGITHYSALYDQSRYFDNALTRYYQSKGWDLQQYSLLRSMSELLILKVLVKRYPDLQQLQVSCHAALKQGDRMVPCGRCEKCRRIVGMLTALDEDPRRCGYDEQKIKNCLHALSSRSVKQIGSDAAHLYHLLKQKDRIEFNPFTRRMAHPHPEIMKLRFDQERSRIEEIPVGIREPLLKILQEYSEGIVNRKDRQWT